MASVPADTHTLPWFPRRDARPHFVDQSGNFVPGDTWKLKPRPVSFFHKHVTVTDAAGLNLYPHLTRFRSGNLAVDQLPIGPRSSRLHSLHARHYGSFPGCVLDNRSAVQPLLRERTPHDATEPSCHARYRESIAESYLLLDVESVILPPAPSAVQLHHGIPFLGELYGSGRGKMTDL